MSAGVVGVAGLLAACSGGDESGAVTRTGGASTGGPGTSSPSPSIDTPEPAVTDSAPPEPAGVVATADVPVGGGVILDDPGIVVAQPTPGQFVAFSSTCTHQGCSVTTVADGLITCPCHGSQYSVADGSVRTGPAEAPLPEVPIVVEADQILLG